MSETVRKTPNGLHITYDDGQNVHVAELRECPWCGGGTMTRPKHYKKHERCPACGRLKLSMEKGETRCTTSPMRSDLG